MRTHMRKPYTCTCSQGEQIPALHACTPAQWCTPTCMTATLNSAHWCQALDQEEEVAVAMRKAVRMLVMAASPPSRRCARSNRARPSRLCSCESVHSLFVACQLSFSLSPCLPPLSSDQAHGQKLSGTKWCSPPALLHACLTEARLLSPLWRKILACSLPKAAISSLCALNQEGCHLAHRPLPHAQSCTHTVHCRMCTIHCHMHMHARTAHCHMHSHTSSTAHCHRHSHRPSPTATCPA